jgi:predicted RNA binding protein YcfA (HicA-like mRNA interferase family)
LSPNRTLAASIQFVRRHGSHAILDKGRVILSIPCHAGRTLKKGLLAALLKDAGLTIDEFTGFL